MSRRLFELIYVLIVLLGTLGAFLLAVHGHNYVLNALIGADIVLIIGLMFWATKYEDPDTHLKSPGRRR